MRGILLVGIVAGIVCGGALALLALAGALVAAPGLLLTGIIAGLAMAKWLPWSWYGRQAAAGLRAGELACGLAGAILLVVLLTAGPRSVPDLEAHSRFLGLSLASWVHALGFVGWVGADLLLCVGAALVGVGLATGVCVLFALGKSARVVAAIADARDAAQALQRGRNLSMPLPGFALPSAPPASGLWHATPLPNGGGPVAGSLLPQPPSQPLNQRITSTARPLDSQLTPEQEAALQAWGDAGRTAEQPSAPREVWEQPWSDADVSDVEGPSEAPSSDYLNSPPAPKRRKRKAPQTRDWLC